MKYSKKPNITSSWGPRLDKVEKDKKDLRDFRVRTKMVEEVRIQEDEFQKDD